VRERGIDLEGFIRRAALLNAHDHLELNHYPRTRLRDSYANAHAWGEDVSARLDDEPFRTLRPYPLADRCFIGGLKNLLCGALTVYHHNPPHRCLFRPDFPVRVLRRYGWAHSLHFTPQAEIVRSYRATPPHVPWFIHLAEGTDDIAAGEYARLKALGCVGANTIIVHGVGLTAADIADAAPRVRALVTCPTTNRYLLGRTLDHAAWKQAGGRLWLGSDSRLTAEGDLLHEAAAVPGVQPECGAEGDWIACHSAGLPAERAALALVVRGGVPQIGDPDVMAKFSRVQTIPALLDGRPKRIQVKLARQIARCTLQERGLELDPDFVRGARRRF
jgi:hypothetical protein